VSPELVSRISLKKGADKCQEGIKVSMGDGKKGAKGKHVESICIYCKWKDLWQTTALVLCVKGGWTVETLLSATIFV
jgi:hypothetical protein